MAACLGQSLPEEVRSESNTRELTSKKFQSPDSHDGVSKFAKFIDSPPRSVNLINIVFFVTLGKKPIRRKYHHAASGEQFHLLEHRQTFVLFQMLDHVECDHSVK